MSSIVRQKPRICGTHVRYFIYFNRIIELQATGMGNSATCKGSIDMTGEEGVKISVRLSSEDMQLIQDFMEENDLDVTISSFIRDAIRGYIADKKVPAEAGEDGIYVRLSEVLIQAMENLKKEGVIFDEESYIRQLVMSDLIPQESLENTKTNAFKAAQEASRMM